MISNDQYSCILNIAYAMILISLTSLNANLWINNPKWCMMETILVE